MDARVMEVITAQAQKHGVRRRTLSKDEILDRHLMALINEGFHILEEGVAQRPGDIDVVYVNGYGFPAYRGGPMFYAAQRGLKEVKNRLEELHSQTGEDYWKPAALLERLVQHGESLDDWMAQKH